MANHGKSVALGFLIIISALFSALVVPSLFNNLVAQETANNENMLHATRIIIIICVIVAIGGAMVMFTQGEKDV